MELGVSTSILSPYSDDVRRATGVIQRARLSKDRRPFTVSGDREGGEAACQLRGVARIGLADTGPSSLNH